MRRATAVLVPTLLFLSAFSLYAATAAPGTLFGDPSEYQVIPAILGIAHPPGYAFYTLLARLWQSLVPVGTVAYRTNLLAACVAAWAVTAVYLIGRDLLAAVPVQRPRAMRGLSFLAPVVAAGSLAVAADVWQHAIHANAHIVSMALAVTHLWLLTRWERSGQGWWLAAFAVTLGLAFTHHPITAMGVPAYGLFIMAVRCRRLRDERSASWGRALLAEWRVLGLLLLGGLVGLLPLLYYPLRSPTAPFGPTDMRTWQGFLSHAMARGLRGNLFHFGLLDQLDRLRVFWSLLRLQFLWPFILSILVGLFLLIRRRACSALLLGLFVLGHLAFTLNTVQDVMAYLLLPFAALAAAASVGLYGILRWLGGATDRRRLARALVLVATALSCLMPLSGLVGNLRRGISLRSFIEAESWVEGVHQRFEGTGEGAVLLSDWEHLTPLWVHQYTQGRSLSPDDVKLVYVSTSNPWVPSVWAHIEEGPIYLSSYRPSVRNEGFRLIPDGPVYRVEAPPADPPEPAEALDVWVDGRLHVLGFELHPPSDGSVQLDLYQQVEEPLEAIWMPYARLGSLEARWTTDSRLLTPQWLPGEVVVERYTIPIPPTMPSGEYRLRLGYADLSGGRERLSLSTAADEVSLAMVTVDPAARSGPVALSPRRSRLANFSHQIALMQARAAQGLGRRRATWDRPLPVRAGQTVRLNLVWQALSAPDDSYTVFVHLIDGAGRVVAGHDYTPLGGASPTYLWFPKWLPGQRYADPYRLAVPADLPPGDYWLEVGLYGMTSLRRLPVVDLAGNLAGDRVILGPLQVK